jgi:ABC-type transport system, involved in lipoprotein release, permease component
VNATSFLAKKFLSGKSRTGLFSLLTWLAILGVAVSVASFIVVEAVMTGFMQDLRGKILGFSSHILIDLSSKETRIGPLTHALQEKLPNGARWSHFVEGEAILRSEDGETAGVRLRGLDPQDSYFPEGFQAFFEDGEDWSSLTASGDKLPGVLLGIELANSLGIVPVLQEGVELLYPLGDVGPTGEVEPNRRALRVVGLFKTGYFDYDNKFALVGMSEARKLLGDSGAERLGIYLPQPDRATPLASQFKLIDGVKRARPWTELNARLFSALRLERWGMAIVLTLMILLSSFNILSLLMMLVFERRREIAVLRSLGMSQRSVGALLLKTGLWLGGVGGALGVGGGVLLCTLLSQARLRLPSPYYIDSLPIQVHVPMLFLGFSIALLLSWAASYFPMREGRRFTIVEALRYE